MARPETDHRDCRGDPSDSSGGGSLLASQRSATDTYKHQRSSVGKLPALRSAQKEALREVDEVRLRLPVLILLFLSGTRNGFWFTPSYSGPEIHRITDDYRIVAAPYMFFVLQRKGQRHCSTILKCLPRSCTHFVHTLGMNRDDKGVSQGRPAMKLFVVRRLAVRAGPNAAPSAACSQPTSQRIREATEKTGIYLQHTSWGPRCG